MKEWKATVNHINVNAGDSTLIRIYSKEKNETKLTYSILIDGGRPAPGFSRVLPFLTEIKKKEPEFNLDAVLVTHYDRDHLGGIENLLPVLPDPDKMSDTNDNGLVDFFRPKSPSPTRFYDTGLFQDTVRATKIYGKYYNKIDKLNNSKEISHITPFDLTQENKLLGHELIEGKQVGILADFCATLDNMRNQHGYRGKPALLCIAVNKHVATPNQPAYRIIPDRPTERNARSIVLILISASDTNQVKYYLPGDLDEKSEEKIVSWMKSYTDIPTNTVTYIKFAHHGSKTSTPISLLKNFKPSYGIISAGHEYWHPSAELLFYLADYNEAQLRNAKQNIQVYALNYPYYLENETEFNKFIVRSSFRQTLMDFKEKIQHSDTCIQILQKELRSMTVSDFRMPWSMIAAYPATCHENYFCISELQPVEDKRISVDMSPDLGVFTSKKRKEYPEVRTGDGTTIQKTKKPHPLLFFYQLKNPSQNNRKAAAPKIKILASSSKEILTAESFKLVENCDLDRFLNTLIAPCLTLNNSERKSVSQKIEIKGSLSNNEINNQLADYYVSWLQIFLNDIEVRIEADLENDKLRVGAKDITFKSKITEDKELSGGLLTHNGEVILGLNANKVQLSLAQMLELIGYEEESSLVEVIQNLLLPSVSQFPADIEFISETNNGWKYTNTLRLKNQLTSRFEIFDKKFALVNPCLILTSKITPSKIDLKANSPDDIVQSFFQQNSLTINSQLEFKILESNINVVIDLQTDGLIKFKIDAGRSKGIDAIGLLIKFVKLFNDSELVNSFENFVTSSGISLTLDEFIIIFYRSKFISLEVLSELKLTAHQSTEKMIEIPLQVKISFPPWKIFGGLSLEKPKEAKQASEDEKSEFDSPEKDMISAISLSDFFLAFAPKGMSPPSSLESAYLANLEYLAEPSSSTYEISADLRFTSDAKSTGCWKFGDIELTDLSFKFRKQKDNYNVVVQTCFKIGKQIAFISGQYIDKQWQFSAGIEVIDIIDIVELLPENIKISLRQFLPENFKIKNFKLILNLTAKTFSISGNIEFEDTITQLNITVFPETTKGKRYLLNINLYCPEKFYSVPLVETLDSPFTSIQVIAAGPGVTTKDWETAEGLKHLKFDEKLLGVHLLFNLKNVSDPLPLALPSIKKNHVTSTSGSKEEKKTVAVRQSPITWVNLDLSLSFIDLQRIGITWGENKQIGIFLDAQLRLGPLAFQLIGFGVFFSIYDATTLPTFTLEGLGLNFKTSTMALGGSFAKQRLEGGTPTLIESYQGQIMLQFPSLNIGGVGVYNKNKDYIDFFVFARLKKALGGPPLFYVNGLSAGFGYNQHLRLPEQNEILDFPLISGKPASSDPMTTQKDLEKVLQQLTTALPEHDPWIFSKKDAFWLAFGLDFSTFNLIFTRALLIADCGRDFQLALLGRSTLQLPQSDSIPPLVKVVLGLAAIIKPAEGTVKVSAQLAADSYIITQECHITGGFAVSMWLKDQSNGRKAGDFVISLGGYHPNFSPPTDYPIVPRLGFNWQVDKNISIGGETYFALTPVCLMFGGGLKVLYDGGDLQAWFKANADILIRWQPLHYEANIGVSVGASYRLNLLFTQATFRVEIGANLELWGTPTGGQVHVDWFIISFTIPFGASRQSLPPQTWQEFRQFLFADSPSSLLFEEKNISKQPARLNKVLISSGLLREEKAQDDSACWIVRPSELGFQIESVMPITNITINNTKTVCPSPIPVTSPFFIKPMSVIKKEDSKTSTIVTAQHKQNIRIVQLIEEDKNSIREIDVDVSNWQWSSIDRHLPSALWGDPTTTADHELLNQPSLLPEARCLGKTLHAPEDTIIEPYGPIQIDKVFKDIELKSGHLPLEDEAAVSSTPYLSDSDLAIEKPPTSKKQMTVCLKQLGIFRPVRLGVKVNPTLYPPLVSSNSTFKKGM